MESTRYPPPKRRRTSSEDSSSSRNSTTEPRSYPAPLRHQDSTLSGRGDMRRGRGYSSSRSRDNSRDDTPARRDRSHTRSPSRGATGGGRRRMSRSPTGSSAYDSAPEHQRSRRPSRSEESRSRSRSRARSDTYSPRQSRTPSQSRQPSASPLPRPSEKPKSLTFTPLVTLPRAHARGITCLKFSPDMALLATSSADNSINIYSVPSSTPSTSASMSKDEAAATPQFKHIRTLRAHLAGVNAITWSPVGPPYTLASASDDKSILLWSPLSSDFPIAPSPLTGHSNYVYSLSFSPKGNMLVSGSFDEAVFLWDVRSGRVMRNLPAHSDPVGGVDFTRDGTMVCSCAGDGLIRIWDAGTGQCLRTLVDEDRKSVTSVKFTPNAKFVLAWTLDNCVRLWNYVEGRCVKTYQGHLNAQYSLGGAVGNYIHSHSHSSSGQAPMKRLEAFVASGSEDGDIVAWDVSSKEILWRGKGHRDVVLGIDFGRTKDGKGLLVSGGKDRDVRIWVLEGEEHGEMMMMEGGFFEKHRHRHGGEDIEMDLEDVVEGLTLYGNAVGVVQREHDGDAMLVDGDTPGMDPR